MSAKCGLVASSLAVAFLVGLAPAQEKIKAAEQLRKENAELRKENAALKQKLRVVDTRAKIEREQRFRVGLLDRAKKERVERTLKIQALKATKERLVKVQWRAPHRPVVLQNARSVLTTLFQDEAGRVLRGVRGEPSPPIPDKDFLKALNALTQATRKLGQIKEPAKARAVVDEMERILADARRALWKLEQKKKKKSPAKK